MTQTQRHLTCSWLNSLRYVTFLYREAEADMGVTMQTPPWLGLNLGDPIRFGDIPIGIQFHITVQVGFQTWIQLYSEIPFCSEVAISRFSHVSFNT